MWDGSRERSRAPEVTIHRHSEGGPGPPMASVSGHGTINIVMALGLYFIASWECPEVLLQN